VENKELDFKLMSTYQGVVRQRWQGSKEMRWQSILVLKHKSNQVANRKFIFREHMEKTISDLTTFSQSPNNLQHS
jgi:hypothetical protein